jgi:hypothetical protein
MRTVRYDPQFERDAAAIEPYSPQFDAIIVGIEWVVARDPGGGKPIGNTGIWARTTRPFSNRREEIVSLTVYYTFDDVFVTMLSVIEEPIGP